MPLAVLNRQLVRRHLVIAVADRQGGTNFAAAHDLIQKWGKRSPFNDADNPVQRLHLGLPFARIPNPHLQELLIRDVRQGDFFPLKSILRHRHVDDGRPGSIIPGDF